MEITRGSIFFDLLFFILAYQILFEQLGGLHFWLTFNEYMIQLIDDGRNWNQICGIRWVLGQNWRALWALAIAEWCTVVVAVVFWQSERAAVGRRIGALAIAQWCTVVVAVVFWQSERAAVGRRIGALTIQEIDVGVMHLLVVIPFKVQFSDS